jgi:hypothetical protein
MMSKEELQKGIREQTICINCHEPYVAELVDYCVDLPIPRDYKVDSFTWKCLHCGFERITFYNYNPPGHWTGD